MKSIGKYWGYLLFAGLITAWWMTEVGPTVLLVLSGLVTVYFLFRVPVWCGATTRENKFCRGNASGILMGCHRRQHKWQKLTLLIVPRAWRELNRGLWTNPSKRLATVSTILGVISTAAALVRSFFE